MKTSKTIKLPSGGSITLSLDDVNVLALSREEWNFVLALVDQVNNGETTFPVVGGPAPEGAGR